MLSFVGLRKLSDKLQKYFYFRIINWFEPPTKNVNGFTLIIKLSVLKNKTASKGGMGKSHPFNVNEEKYCLNS